TEPNTETKEPARRSKLKWLKSNEAEAWRNLDLDLIKTLEGSLRGGAETKLNLIGDIIYQACKDRFGEIVPKQMTASREKGRREREILQLVQRRRQLRKNWRKATHAEREGLKVLWEEVRKRLAGLRRAERIRKRSQRKQKERANFFKDPFKYARQLLEEKKSGKLEITREKLEQHVKEQYSDPQRSVPLGTPGYVPQPAKPTAEFNIMPPKLSEVRQVVEKARSSAPGPNGVPYKLYKNCPKVLELLWYLMRTAWKKQIIPSEWQRAVAVFIPKETNSKDISQFRSIALLNVEGKIFFSVLARRMTNYLLENGYVDTNCQKAGVPGFPGCVEHSTMIWDQIQKAKRENTDLHVIWLDLANAYGSVPHQLVNYATEFFHMPICVKNLVAQYFSNLQMCFSLQDFTTGWQRLEVGIAMGCTISPILFVAAFEIILIGARQMVGGIKLPTGKRLPPLRSYMDDVTSLLQTAACTSRLLKRMDELMSWARMKIKPSKSLSLNDNTIFVVGGEKIPLLSEQPIKSLERQYTADLSDKQMGKTVMKQLSDGLARIDQSQLPGKWTLDQVDESVRNTNAKVPTGRNRLQHQEIMGRVHAGRVGLGWGVMPRFWSKANRKQRKEMVVAEVTRMEEDRYKIKAVWTTWDGIMNWNISWSDVWKIPQARLSFLIRSTYDTLPCPRNLHQWFLCNAPNASCKIALSQGRYRWRHDQYWRNVDRIANNYHQQKTPPSLRRKEGETARLFSSNQEWNMRVDLDRQLRFPTEITTTPLRPDIVVWSTKARSVHLIELTVPLEEGIEAAFERKKAKYSELAVELPATQWREAGVTGGKLRRATKDLAEEERYVLGEEHLTPDSSCRENCYQLQGVTGRRDVPELKERNVGEWWFLADDPAADSWALEEVQQTAMPSRW
ncbi:hypothetical protein M9458_015738, partial [Cirrhinus mrigala]